MRAWLGITLALTGCSLVVNPRAQNEYDLVDAAQGTIPDGGEGRSDAATDAGPDGGLDAGLDVPASPVLRFPWNGYMTGSVHTGALPAERNALRPRFVWEPSEGAERYEIQLTASCEAQTRETCAFDGAIDGVTSETEWRPEAALPVSMSAPVGRRYVWRARACNAAGCSDWSQVRYLDVGRQPSDFNGDGYADVLIGAPGEDAGAEGQAGRSFTFYGPAPAESVGAYQTEHPTVANAAFGGSVAAVGDVNGDGFSDAIITAPLASYGGTALAGRALFFPGGADQLPMRPEATLESLHPVSEGLFGVAVAGAGDLDGDGFSDVVISADGEEVGGVQRAGRVYVFAGSAGGFVAPPVELTSPTPTPAGRFGCFGAAMSQTAGTWFGERE